MIIELAAVAIMSEYFIHILYSSYDDNHYYRKLWTQCFNTSDIIHNKRSNW